jgi:hypothetical protein
MSRQGEWGSQWPKASTFFLRRGRLSRSFASPVPVLKAYWANPTPEGRQKLVDAVSEKGFRDEFVGEIDARLAQRIPPDLWKLSWPLMTPQRREITVGLMESLRENFVWFPKYQAYLCASAAEADRMGASGRLHARRLGVRLSEGPAGRHWALETNLAEIVALVRDFFGRVYTRRRRRGAAALSNAD